jgi:hypothetical protein
MGTEHGERWRPSDSAGSALVLLVAGLWWAAVSVVTGLLSVALLVTRPGHPADTDDDL